MNNSQNIDLQNRLDETDVRQYLQMLQDVINRMASNSANCKNWALTLLAALLALCTGVPELRDYCYISVIPTLMFWGLDFYYLLQENRFRSHEKDFIRKYYNNDSEWKELLYSFNCVGFNLFWHCFKSCSLILFYPIIIGLIIILHYMVS